MALNIKDPEADRLARKLAAQTGETVTEAVVKALRERSKREGAKSLVRLKDEIMAISRRAPPCRGARAVRPNRSSATTSAACPADGRRYFRCRGDPVWRARGEPFRRSHRDGCYDG